MKQSTKVIILLISIMIVFGVAAAAIDLSGHNSFDTSNTTPTPTPTVSPSSNSIGGPASQPTLEYIYSPCL